MLVERADVLDGTSPLGGVVAVRAWIQDAVLTFKPCRSCRVVRAAHR